MSPPQKARQPAGSIAGGGPPRLPLPPVLHDAHAGVCNIKRIEVRGSPSVRDDEPTFVQFTKLAAQEDEVRPSQLTAAKLECPQLGAGGGREGVRRHSPSLHWFRRNTLQRLLRAMALRFCTKELQLMLGTLARRLRPTDHSRSTKGRRDQPPVRHSVEAAVVSSPIASTVKKVQLARKKRGRASRE